MKLVTKNQLISWKLLAKEGEKYYATNGFLLLAGNEAAFPDAYIQCALFKGTDMHLIESWGTGIPRIFRDAKRYGLKEPEMKNMGISFRITMYRKTETRRAYSSSRFLIPW